jgi:alkanesulfonate monooxygenase SsuD/methylene tetrahydromethanopterin reductase-like flavin-dependent oxidoreductase (luciferase family)
MQSPNIIAAALLHRVKRAKICVWGTPPNLGYPNRLAEEYAMIDVLSGGRLEIAFPLGTGMEYWAHPVNPSTSRQRYRESLDIILKCWTEDGPQKYYGDFYTYRFLNPWPKPLQKPYPPCYIVGTGSPETIELAAELGFGYSAVFVTRDKARELNDKLRERSAHYGHPVRPEQLPMGVMTYVAETDEIAEKEGLEHIQYFFEVSTRTIPQFLAPPGYLSPEQIRARAAVGDKMHGSFNFKNLQDMIFLAVGGPEKVANLIGEWTHKMGTSHVNIQGHLGNIPNWKAVKNMTIFAEEVMPRLRGRGISEVREAAE